MVKEKRVWAVVCGAVRQEFELVTVLSVLCEYRSRKLLEGIVLSTWKGELEHIPDLRSKLRYLNIYVIESESVDEARGKYMSLNYLRQITQLNAGLDFIPEDVFVLKCRTDFCNEHLKQMEDVLNFNINLSIGSHGNCNFGLNYKIGVFRYTISLPFCFLDLCFFAYKHDMRKMLSFESGLERYGVRGMPDFLFFMNVFSNNFPIIPQYYKTIDCYRLGNLLFKYKNRLAHKNFTLPKLMIKFYALYFVLLHNCFCQVTVENVLSIDYAKMKLRDVFTCNGAYGFKRTWLTQINNAVWVGYIVSGNIVMDNAYKALYQEIIRLSHGNYALNQHITQDDINEMAVWLECNFKVDPKTIIHVPKIDYGYVDSPDINFDTAVAVLTNNKSTVLNMLIREICFSGSNYYSNIISSFEIMKELDDGLFELSLYAASRNLDPSVLRLISERLLGGKVANRHLESAKFIFERYKNDNTAFPMTIDKLNAAYNYSIWTERNGDTDFARIFFAKICAKFKVQKSDENSPEKCGYEKSIMAVLIDAANGNYTDYSSDASIRYIIDFLTEKCEDNPFAKETLHWLGENQPEKYKEIKEKYDIEKGRQ